MGSRPLVFLVFLHTERSKSNLISRKEGGGLDLCLYHLLMSIEPVKTNQEVDFLDKTGKIQTNLTFGNQNRAEGFIWQEIGSKIRKVCENLVHPVGVTLYLNRKTVKDRRNRLYIDGFAVNFQGPNFAPNNRWSPFCNIVVTKKVNLFFRLVGGAALISWFFSDKVWWWTFDFAAAHRSTPKTRGSRIFWSRLIEADFEK